MSRRSRTGRTSVRVAVVAASALLMGVPLPEGSSPAGSAAAADAAVYARLYNQGTGKCLTVPDPPTTNGIALVQSTCGTGASGYWTLEAVPEGHRVRSQASAKCLAIGGGSTAPGAKAIQWTCGDGDEQVWVQDDIDRLRNVKSGLCLAIPGSSTANDVEAVQRPCSLNRDQQWLW